MSRLPDHMRPLSDVAAHRLKRLRGQLPATRDELLRLPLYPGERGSKNLTTDLATLGCVCDRGVYRRPPS